MITSETNNNENVPTENENRTNMIHSSQLIIGDVKVLALATWVSNRGNERHLAQWAFGKVMAATLCNTGSPAVLTVTRTLAQMLRVD